MNGLTEAIVRYTQMEIAVARARDALADKVTRERADRLASLVRSRDREMQLLDEYIVEMQK